MATSAKADGEEDADDQESFGDDHVLTLLLGDTAKIRILAALISESDHDLSITEIARIAGVDRSTVYDNIDDLVELDVVINTRRTAGEMYQINTDNPVAQHLAQLEWELLDYVSTD